MQRRGLVLLATMSESDTIEAVLQEVAESVAQLQRFGWVFEVLVVDDGGDRAFHSLCTKLGAEYGLSLRVVEGPRAGLGGAVLATPRGAHHMTTPSGRTSSKSLASPMMRVPAMCFAV